MPPITPLEFDELAPQLQDALRSRYERLGYLGDFFRAMGHQPAAVAAFETFTQSCKEALGVRLAETVALTAATRLGNDYERNQHERLAVRSGATRQWVAAVEALEPDSDRDDLEGAERAVQRFVLAAIDDLAGEDEQHPAEALEALVALAGDATAAAVTLLTARFVGHALVSRACRLQPVVPSIFDDGFGADAEAGSDG